MNPAELFQRYEVDSLTVARDRDIRNAEASRITIDFESGYRVSFKLLEGNAAAVHRHLAAIGPAPEHSLQLTQDGQTLSPEALQELLGAFLDAIAGRVAKIHKEQSILNIQPLGKRFVLHGRTRFEVLEDDGKGQLTIRINHPEGEREAGLTANDLLDGLYAGIITLD